jgi:hypothetical protein
MSRTVSMRPVGKKRHKKLRQKQRSKDDQYSSCKQSKVASSLCTRTSHTRTEWETFSESLLCVW